MGKKIQRYFLIAPKSLKFQDHEIRIKNKNELMRSAAITIVQLWKETIHSCLLMILRFNEACLLGVEGCSHHDSRSYTNEFHGC